MPLKTFKEMYELEISSYTQKKPTFKKNAQGKLERTSKDKWLEYIEWATVIFLLYENGAESVTYGFERDNNYPAFYHKDRNPFVMVWVKIDDKQFALDYPVIDGNKVNATPDQMGIHRAQQRAFVKCVAINTGLGLKLWQKEEGTFNDNEPISENTLDLPELLPDTPLWQKAIESLNNGFKIGQIKKKYFISPENEEKLCNEAI
jgi:hypothetical protein